MLAPAATVSAGSQYSVSVSDVSHHGQPCCCDSYRLRDYILHPRENIKQAEVESATNSRGSVQVGNEGKYYIKNHVLAAVL